MQNASTTNTFPDPNRLKETLIGILGNSSGEPQVIPMTGDASDRRYYRARFNDNKSESVVIMQLSSPIEEGGNDFIRISNYLQNLKTRVPEIYQADNEKGLIFLEDCGDLTLADSLSSSDEKKQLYSKAVSELAVLQNSAKIEDAYFTRSFDMEKLMWEMDFMLTHYIEGLLKTPLPPKQREAWTRELTLLCEFLAGQPKYFVHRDFHSRNLMVHNGELIWIDFQDARLGPCQYDLASLLRDSYVELDKDFRLEMIDLFLERHRELGNSFDRNEFLKVFDWMSIQRNLKAIGTFAFQKMEKKTDRYLQYIAPTLGYLKEALDCNPELEGIYKLLKQSTEIGE